MTTFRVSRITRVRIRVRIRLTVKYVAVRLYTVSQKRPLLKMTFFDFPR